MSGDKHRQERIERLLKELEHEVVRGMMQGEISEWLTFTFFVPVSKEIEKGVVKCEFKTQPFGELLWSRQALYEVPKLKVIIGGKK